MLKNQHPAPYRFLSVATHGLWCNSLHPKALVCLICMFNQHANKSIYFSKAITSRNDTAIKQKMHTKKPETDRLIVHSPQRSWSLSPEKLAIMKTTTSIVCFCLVLCALVCTCEKALEAFLETTDLSTVSCCCCHRPALH